MQDSNGKVLKGSTTIARRRSFWQLMDVRASAETTPPAAASYTAANMPSERGGLAEEVRVLLTLVAEQVVSSREAVDVGAVGLRAVEHRMSR